MPDDGGYRAGQVIGGAGLEIAASISETQEAWEGFYLRFSWRSWAKSVPASAPSLEVAPPVSIFPFWIRNAC